MASWPCRWQAVSLLPRLARLDSIGAAASRHPGRFAGMPTGRWSTTMAFLITWNPQQERWHDMPLASPLTLSGELYKDWWGVRNKSVNVGSRLFLLRQGVEPKGIVGSGWATSPVRLRTPPEPGRAKFIVDAVF